MTIIRNAVYELDMPPDQRHSAFLGPYDLDLKVKTTHITIGRFSFGLLNAVKFLPNRRDGSVLEVGCFCEASNNVKIIVGGNHQNDNLFNHNFSSGKMFLRLMDDENRNLCEVAPARPVVIGDNVVLSDGATVTPGSQIGSGSVLAAGAVVAGSLPPLGIYAGVPARLLRQRFNEEKSELYSATSFGNVAAHSLGLLPTVLMRLQNGEISLDEFRSALDFVTDRPVIEMMLEPRPNSDRGIQLGAIVGYRVGDTRITDEAAIQKLNSYFAQIQSDQPKVKWIPDIFDALGLYN